MKDSSIICNEFRNISYLACMFLAVCQATPWTCHDAHANLIRDYLAILVTLFPVSLVVIIHLHLNFLTTEQQLANLKITSRNELDKLNY